MIGQYLPNNNEKRYSAILLKILHLNRPQVLARRFSPAGVRRSFEASSVWQGSSSALLETALALDLVLEQIIWWS
jgi:hypothetical protein